MSDVNKCRHLLLCSLDIFVPIYFPHLFGVLYLCANILPQTEIILIFVSGKIRNGLCHRLIEQVHDRISDTFST